MPITYFGKSPNIIKISTNIATLDYNNSVVIFIAKAIIFYREITSAICLQANSKNLKYRIGFIATAKASKKDIKNLIYNHLLSIINYWRRCLIVDIRRGVRVAEGAALERLCTH